MRSLQVVTSLQGDVYDVVDDVPGVVDDMADVVVVANGLSGHDFESYCLFLQ